MSYYGIIESICEGAFTAGVYSTISDNKVCEFTDKLARFRVGPPTPKVLTAFQWISTSTGHRYEINLYYSWEHKRKLDPRPEMSLSGELQKSLNETIEEYIKTIEASRKGQ